ncbi:MAG: Gfo/Idh/MocA family oxidoreductase [Verrucomicrobia bacterium]|nr:Gfo/Idh/MocA family oxidoreductase [Verrucomicrobiota bacterium]
MKNDRSPSRRAFLKRAIATVGGTLGIPAIVPCRVLGAGGQVPPGNRITMGFIGTGDHGTNRNLKGFLAHADAQIVGVCDVDAARCQAAKRVVEEKYAEATKQERYKGCAAHRDFRELIARSDLDAVMVSTPDHWHVIPSVLAARAGKDVICEKPLTLTVAEGRVLSDTMKRHNRVFQTSSENRSQQIKVYHRLCELVRNGRIGKLQAIRVGLPAGHWIKPASQEIGPPPKGFDYDFWLGQAPEAPYCEARCHWNFRWILDYSGGMLTDWGAHLIDIAQWGNNTELTGPVTVEGKGQFPGEGLYNTATKFDLDYTYANGVKLNVAAGNPSIRFEGTEGWIGNSGWAAKLESEPKTILDSVVGPNETQLYSAANEHRNFLDCVKSRKPCYAPAEVGHRTITIAHIGHIAMRLGRKLTWDPEKERFADDQSANQMLSRPMRAPWKL